MTKISEKGIEKAAFEIVNAVKDGEPTWREAVRAAIAAYLDVVEGETDTIRAERDLARASLWKLQTGAAMALNALSVDEGPVYEFLVAIHRESVVGQLAIGPVINEGSDPELTKYRNAAASELAGMEAPASAPAPAGWRVVPVEPTQKMLNEGDQRFWAKDTYRAMLAAAPEPPVSEAKPKRYRKFHTPCSEMTSQQLLDEDAELERLWQEISEDRKGGGSPGEWIHERSAEITTERDRRLPVAPKGME